MHDVHNAVTPNAPFVAAKLSDEVSEQIFAVVAATLETTLLPLFEKQKELEARLTRVQQVHAEQDAAMAALRAAPAAIPVSIAPAALPSAAPRAPMVSTTYGFVTAPQTPPARSEMEIALERVGPVDVPDFGRGRRAGGTILVGLLLAAVVAAIAATILSHT